MLLVKLKTYLICYLHHLLLLIAYFVYLSAVWKADWIYKTNFIRCCLKYVQPTSKIHMMPFFMWRCDPTRVMASSYMRFLDHTQRRITVGRTPLDEWSARRRDLYLTTHNTHNRQTSMPQVGFEPTISAGERPQTYALDRAATGTGIWYLLVWYITEMIWDPAASVFAVDSSFETPAFIYQTSRCLFPERGYCVIHRRENRILLVHFVMSLFP